MQNFFQHHQDRPCQTRRLRRIGYRAPHPRRRGILLVALSLSLSLGLMLGSLWLAPTASAAPLNAHTERLSGTDRIETAIRVSQKGWAQADTVLLARADDYPDSLVAVPLSHHLDAPILLTYPGELDPAVLTEIKRLGAHKVILLGGTGVLGEKITAPLQAGGIALDRVGGQDRYDTAIQVARRLEAGGDVVLVSGENFPDAVAIGPYAGATETPILLTTKKGLPEQTRTLIKDLQASDQSAGGEKQSKTIVVGGEGVIPSATLTGLPGLQRIAGADRYETAAKAYWFAAAVLDANQAYLATGENFPDALVAGALAAKQNAPLFLSPKGDVPPLTYSAMGNATKTEPLQVALLGGSAVLSAKVEGIVQGGIQPPYLLAGVSIIVDPGHGGPDPGAHGPSDTWEKNNNLALGLKLTDVLRSAGAKVILTRSADVAPSGSGYEEGVDLDTRTTLANKAKADLFISLHNDAAGSPGPGGTATYYSPANPQAGRSETLAGRSAALANAVQTELVKQIGLSDRHVREAGYYVLKHTDMPSVLVEVGFISNPTEEKLLASPDFQQKAALGIYRGILVYEGF